jgi:hypothetical protein
MFKVSPASLQTFIDTSNCVLEDIRLTLTPSIVHNSNYVIMLSDWNGLKYICVFLYCNRQVHRDILITLCNTTLTHNTKDCMKETKLYRRGQC